MRTVDDTMTGATVSSMIQCPHCRMMLHIALTEAD